MTFSKSFGYALRGILYVSLLREEERKISIEEIADRLSVPRHFLGKVMKSVVKAGFLSSTRGPQGGFYVNEQTLSTPIISILLLTEGKDYFNACLLSLRKCNAANPCPLHNRLGECKKELLSIYSQTTIDDMLAKDKPEFIKSIATFQPA